ncbi:hypothetical protein PAPYR_9268 [Paratrimastix pyriformis]|uniref:Uncharacterized protein n=1 Tax=Paratrimastix pyriformis TaxID=342808 RepID=A0ABQ8U8S1_9EUKA|nr:hypothetical protein PAPYR_9268 [Paratrimastix pyriformis]
MRTTASRPRRPTSSFSRRTSALDSANEPQQHCALTKELIAHVVNDFETARNLGNDIPNFLPLQLGASALAEHRFRSHVSMRRLLGMHTELGPPISVPSPRPSYVKLPPSDSTQPWHTHVPFRKCAKVPLSVSAAEALGEAGTPTVPMSTGPMGGSRPRPGSPLARPYSSSSAFLSRPTSALVSPLGSARPPPLDWPAVRSAVPEQPVHTPSSMNVLNGDADMLVRPDFGDAANPDEGDEPLFRDANDEEGGEELDARFDERRYGRANASTTTPLTRPSHLTGAKPSSTDQPHRIASQHPEASLHHSNTVPWVRTLSTAANRSFLSKYEDARSTSTRSDELNYDYEEDDADEASRPPHLPPAKQSLSASGGNTLAARRSRSTSPQARASTALVAHSLAAIPPVPPPTHHPAAGSPTVGELRRTVPLVAAGSPLSTPPAPSGSGGRPTGFHLDLSRSKPRIVSSSPPQVPPATPTSATAAPGYINPNENSISTSPTSPSYPPVPATATTTGGRTAPSPQITHPRPTITAAAVAFSNHPQQQERTAYPASPSTQQQQQQPRMIVIDAGGPDGLRASPSTRSFGSLHGGGVGTYGPTAAMTPAPLTDTRARSRLAITSTGAVRPRSAISRYTTPPGTPTARTPGGSLGATTGGGTPSRLALAEIHRLTRGYNSHVDMH